MKLFFSQIFYKKKKICKFPLGHFEGNFGEFEEFLGILRRFPSFIFEKMLFFQKIKPK
jgi:hypothetical protein